MLLKGSDTFKRLNKMETEAWMVGKGGGCVRHRTAIESFCLDLKMGENWSCLNDDGRESVQNETLVIKERGSSSWWWLDGQWSL